MIILAGGIGAGKSVVARILRLKGFGVYDCDFEARRLMESDPEVKAKILEAAGGEVYDTEGRLDRRLLASRLFTDASLRGEINAIVHACVLRDVKRWLEERQENVFVETAIAAESGLAREAESIWIVEASTETRVSRVKNRDSRPEEEILRIMQAQTLEEEKLAKLGVPFIRIANDEDSPILETINYLLNKEKC